MKHQLERGNFSGAADLAELAARANGYLFEICAACKAGDKMAAVRALRKAVNELEIARAGVRIGID
jgi:methylaspartate ammonia-lyase